MRKIKRKKNREEMRTMINRRTEERDRGKKSVRKRRTEEVGDRGKRNVREGRTDRGKRQQRMKLNHSTYKREKKKGDRNRH